MYRVVISLKLIINQQGMVINPFEMHASHPPINHHVSMISP